MNRLISVLASAVAGLWVCAMLAWLNVPPGPNRAACATAIETATRAALVVDPNLVEIRTPTECYGLNDAELATVVAGTTPIARPRVEQPEPTRTRPAPAIIVPRRTVTAIPARPSTPTTVPATTPAPVPSSTAPTVSPTPADSSDSPSPAVSPSTAAPVGEPPVYAPEGSA